MNVLNLTACALCVGTAASAYAVPATYQRYIGTPALEEGCATARTRDGGSVIAATRRTAAGGTRNIIIIKLDYTGATQWEREVIRPDDEVPLSITQTFDGGYALVGLKKSSPTLFTEMTWSHPQVMQITRNKAERIGLHCDELAPVHDIDEPEDLQHWTP